MREHLCFRPALLSTLLVLCPAAEPDEDHEGALRSMLEDFHVLPPCMSTIPEDPSCDSHLAQEALDQDFRSPTVSARQSFEDLTENRVSRMKARRHRQQRQRDMDSRETAC